MEIATRRREQEVWQACDDLFALQGDLKLLTGDAIRERLLALGKSKGSPNEIYKYRKSWSQSRGINSAATKGFEEDADPITRAVRLVHEKLQAEAEEQIAALKQECLVQLNIKEQEIERQKSDIAAVFIELEKASSELKMLKAEIKDSQKRIEAEISIRQALERELVLVKNNLEQSLAHKEELLKESRRSLEFTSLELKNAYSAQEKRLSDSIEKLLEEKRELGFQFSEQLNAQKMESYDKNQKIERLQEKLHERQNEAEAKEIELKAGQSKLAFINEEHMKERLRNNALSERLAIVLSNELQSAATIKHLLLVVKKQELNITRLRLLNRGDFQLKAKDQKHERLKSAEKGTA
jgi:chromosome segregation ATPase